MRQNDARQPRPQPATREPRCVACLRSGRAGGTGNAAFFGQMSQTVPRPHTAIRLLRMAWPILGVLLIMPWQPATAAQADPAAGSQHTSPTASDEDSPSSDEATLPSGEQQGEDSSTGEETAPRSHRDWYPLLISLGFLLLLGLATDAVGRHTPLPRVTLLVLFGVIVGPSCLDLLPEGSRAWYPLIADVALLMIGFLLGEKLSWASLKDTGKEVFWISALVIIGTAAVMFAGLTAMGVRTELALLLAALAPATDPAAVTNVVYETRSSGRFTDVLLGIVAVDDAWGLIMFSLLLAVAETFTGAGGAETIQHGAWELGGALLVGVGLGIPAALLTGRIRPGEPMQSEALGVVFLAGGLALWIGVSHLLTAMVVGATVANLAQHHKRPFHAIENIQWPFMVLFFLLAGASFRVGRVVEIGWIGLAYLVLRVAGRSAGAWAGGTIGQADPQVRHWMGMAILPQAGVALGMALVATDSFPELRDVILPVVIGSTVLFELAGPCFTRLALMCSGDAGNRGD